jgi:ATP-binding cassette, subfamily C (CFTR/MRP), member 1
MAFSMAYYQHKTYQLVTRLRGTLASTVFLKSLCIPASRNQDNAPITLMNTDVDKTTTGLQVIHELWASLFEAGIAAWLLERQIGFLYIVPFSITLGKHP